MEESQQGPACSVPNAVSDDALMSVSARAPTKAPTKTTFFQRCVSTFFDLAILAVCPDPTTLAALGLFAMLHFGGEK